MIDYPFVFILLYIFTYSLLLIYFFADPSLTRINPYIRHWEAAQFNIEPFENARLHHDSQLQRRKRETNVTSSVYGNGPANTIKFSFYAHDR